MDPWDDLFRQAEDISDDQIAGLMVRTRALEDALIADVHETAGKVRDRALASPNLTLSKFLGSHNTDDADMIALSRNPQFVSWMILADAGAGDEESEAAERLVNDLQRGFLKRAMVRFESWQEFRSFVVAARPEMSDMPEAEIPHHSYRDFLDKHPDASYLNRARRYNDRKAFERLVLGDSKSMLENASTLLRAYRAVFPDDKRPAANPWALILP